MGLVEPPAPFPCKISVKSLRTFWAYTWKFRAASSERPNLAADTICMALVI